MDSSKYVVDESTGCWNFLGCKDAGGYGRIRVNYKHWQAHRYSLSLVLGRDIKRGMVVMHKCDNPACVNPEHLLEATQRDNMLDCIQKGRGGARGSGKYSPTRGNRDPAAERIQKVMRAYRRGMTAQTIAAQFGWRPAWIRKVIRENQSENGFLK